MVWLGNSKKISSVQPVATGATPRTRETCAFISANVEDLQGIAWMIQKGGEVEKNGIAPPSGERKERFGALRLFIVPGNIPYSMGSRFQDLEPVAGTRHGSYETLGLSWDYHGIIMGL